MTAADILTALAVAAGVVAIATGTLAAAALGLAALLERADR